MAPHAQPTRSVTGVRLAQRSARGSVNASGAARSLPRHRSRRRPRLPQTLVHRERSRIPACANLVRRIEKHADAIIAAVELSNSRLEGINAKIRLIRRRGFGYRNLDALTAAIYLCLGGVTLDLLRKLE
ncbi:transposase [Actinoplanes sp. NPDC049681]|uniref:transposase n=1 Tax=Actinoplanes sp. NPDC049681 TaxID=3363905 RepID=UPI0037B9C307